MDWLDLLAVQGTLKSLLQHHSSKASILRCSAFFMVQLSHPYVTTGKSSYFSPNKTTLMLCIFSSPCSLSRGQDPGANPSTSPPRLAWGPEDPCPGGALGAQHLLRSCGHTPSPAGSLDRCGGGGRAVVTREPGWTTPQGPEACHSPGPSLASVP